MNHWITRAISSGLFQDDDPSPAVPLPDAGIVPGGSLKVCSLFLGRAPHMGFPANIYNILLTWSTLNASKYRKSFAACARTSTLSISSTGATAAHEPASLWLSRLPRQSRTYSAPTTTDPLPKSEASLLPYP